MEFFFGFYEKINEAVIKRCHELYGDALPKEVTERLEVEWAVLEERDWAVTLRALTEVKRICNDKGGRFFISGPLESSFIAYLLGISYIDPLPPHYLCPECKHADFPKDPPAFCGPDIPDRLCPSCGTPMLKSGFDAQFEFLFSRVWPYSQVIISNRIIESIRDGLSALYKKQKSEIDSGFMHLCSKPDGAACIDLSDQDDYDEEVLLLQQIGLDFEEVPPACEGIISELFDETIRIMRRDRPLTKEIADAVSPSCFEDVIRIDGLSCVEGTW
ncbi:MAG: hypothetical protein K6G56_08635 [Clostridiales bacterium]|nr:hypothetical protein [Clostridiales bacterium]